MDSTSKPIEDLEDPDYFHTIKEKIEQELINLKKAVNDINQLRVEAAYIESDMLLSIDSATWENIAEFIGAPTSVKFVDTNTDKFDVTDK